MEMKGPTRTEMEDGKHMGSELASRSSESSDKNNNI